jgi:GNAT superfamily N-acetyltransferase
MEYYYVEWNRGAQSLYEEIKGDYVMSYDVSLKVYQDDTYVCAASAEVILTDERWIKNKGNLSLVEHVHYDFNDEMNWNDYTIYEYLEDTLRCTNYGLDGGTNGKIARILKIQIQPEFRGNGHFSYFLERIIPTLLKWDVNYISLMPQPFGNIYPNECSDEEKEKILDGGIIRLQNFYSRFGFKILANEGIPYIIFYNNKITAKI